MDMKLKDRIVEYRAAHNISQTEMARRCEVTMQTISGIERGLQSPSRLTLAKINRVLDEDSGKGVADAAINQ